MNAKPHRWMVSAAAWALSTGLSVSTGCFHPPGEDSALADLASAGAESFASAAGPPRDSSASRFREPVELDGILLEVRVAQLLLDIENGSDCEVLVDPSTVITLNGRGATLHDLAPRMSAHIVAEAQEDLVTALTIDAKTEKQVTEMPARSPSAGSTR